MKSLGILLFISLALSGTRVVSAQGAVEGSVRDSAGRPLAHARVHASQAQRRARADAGGNYRLDGLPTGNVGVVAFVLGYVRDSVTVVVRAGRTIRHDIVMRGFPGWTVRRQEQWLGCARAPAGRCTPARRVGSALAGLEEPGAWVFRDSVSLRRFWLVRPSLEAPVPPLPAIDWRHESLIAVSYGGYSGCGPRRYVNRIERIADTTIVIVGPDSTYDGPGRVTCQAWLTTPDLVVSPRVDGPIVFRGANALEHLPASVVVDP